MLSRLSWPAEVRAQFLAGLARGNPALPEVQYPTGDLSGSLAELTAICGELRGEDHPLATFSELVTGAIDISRMERIALRVVATDMALNGADFIEVFQYFINLGQSQMESFSSAMRIFRGAPLTGGAAFTKDVVYLHGLMEVHTFFRWAMHHQRLGLCRHFFSGRMTIGDTIQLAPLFADGTLTGPRYLPPWMVRTNGLAAYLAFSVFANKISIADLGENHPFNRVSDMGL